MVASAINPHQIVLPDFSEMCPPMWVDYDREGDRLMVRLVETPVPAYSYPIDDYVSWRVDLDTDHVVGFEVERFRARAVKQIPELLPILEMVDGRRRSTRQPAATVEVKPERREALKPIFQRPTLAHA